MICVGLEDRHTGPPHSIQVPFPKVPRLVTIIFERLRECLLLKAEIMAVRRDACPHVGSPGQHRCPGWRAHGAGRVKTVESNAV